MGLIGLEVAEIAESAAAETTAATATAATSSAATAPAATTKAASTSTKTTATSAAASSGTATARTTSAGTSASRTAAAWATLATKRRIHLCVLAQLLHIDSGKGIGRSRLAGDGNRVGGEIRVVGHRRQSCPCGAAVNPCILRACELGQQGQTLGAAGAIAPHRARLPAAALTTLAP